MKIIISSKGKELDSEVDGVFGRCQYFFIAEVVDKKIAKFEAVENTSINQMGGAGISAAKQVSELGAEAVISGNVGPRAVDVLKQFNIKIYKGAGTIKEVIQKLIEDKLEQVE